MISLNKRKESKNSASCKESHSNFGVVHKGHSMRLSLEVLVYVIDGAFLVITALEVTS